MGRNLPSSRQAALTWLESIVAQWNTNQAAIGITSATIIDLSVDVANARQAFSSVELARTNAKSKTQDWYAQMDATHKAASDLISTVKSYAATQDPPSAVYTLAGLTPKDPPQPVAAPEQPTNGNAQLGGNGAVIINFDARGSAGTVWQVWRKLGTETGYTFLGSADSTTKSYADNTVPAGESSTQYTVQGVRGSVKGPVSFAINVQFGGVTGAQDEAAA